ncbi:hypothetical protein V2A60_008701 [Cordyceps javanica]
MPSTPDQPGHCACCPYPGSFSCQEAEKIGVHADGTVECPDAATSSERSLRLEYQLSDPGSRERTSPGPATATGSWDPATTITAPRTTGEAAPAQDDWTGIQATSQGASTPYPDLGERPPKRSRNEFEAGVPLKQYPGPSSHSNCFQALEAELAAVIWTHIGSSHVRLSCTGTGHDLRLSFAC